MSSWNAMTYEGKDTILRVVRKEAEQFFALADSDEAWQAPTGAGHWQVRDIVGHLVDTTEAYFPAFDAARNSGIESAPVRPACLAHRRVSEPGGTRQLYFLLLEGDAFTRLRDQLGVDANAQSPVLLVAEADGEFNRWLPLRADADTDCVAPVESAGR